jgi:DNA-binding LacI/PurR family transcriptional regulator
MSTTPAKAVTIQDLARLAGVTKSAVSVVLNHRDVGIRVGAEQRAKILALAKELNYTPRASACALSTGRTYHIGFLLSSKICLGLANTYFATVLSGVQQACQAQGYNCTVSTYDLSTIKNFIMPKKLRQRSVDGVIITGQVEAKVIKLFLAQQIPVVMVGDTTDFPLHDLLAIASDMVTSWVNAFAHLSQLGHRHLVFPGYFDNDRRSHDLLTQGIQRFQELHPASPLKVDIPLLRDTGEDMYQRAFAAGLAWTQASPRTRPTALISHDQWCIGFMAGVQRGGLACPRDLSIISNNTTPLCRWVSPALTAIDLEPYERGQAATGLLIDLLEKRLSLAEAHQRTAASWTPGRLVERESVGPAPVEASMK